jgi:hypothetical protein
MGFVNYGVVAICKNSFNRKILLCKTSLKNFIIELK